MMTPEEYSKLLALYRGLCDKPRPKIPMDVLIPPTKKYIKWLEETKKKALQAQNEDGRVL